MLLLSTLMTQDGLQKASQATFITAVHHVAGLPRRALVLTFVNLVSIVGNFEVASLVSAQMIRIYESKWLSAGNGDLKGEGHTSISALTIRRGWNTVSSLLGPPVMDEVALEGGGGGGNPV